MSFVKALSITLVMLSSSSYATEIYPVNRLGEREYHKNHLEVKNGRIVEVTPTGKVEYHKQQYIIRDNKILPVTSTGQVQHHKPAARSK
jgi:hypothetical protein